MTQTPDKDAADRLFREICAQELYAPSLANEPASHCALNFLTNCVSVVQALAIAELMFPKIVQYRGGVFLEAHFEDKNVDEWLLQPGLDLRAVEAVVNHIHLARDQFHETPSEHMPLVRRLADILSESWPAWIKKTYGLDVEVSASEADDDIEITLVSKSKAQS
jgi:hypothetical protein